MDAARDALAAPEFLLFKHSYRCGISTRAQKAYEAFLAESDVPSGWIDVVDDRPISLWVAEETGVTHASPQVIYLRNGEVVWHESQFAITKEALEAATSPTP